MEIINIPRLRNKEIQTVGESSLRICSEIPEVKQAYDKASATMQTFIKGMQKDKVDALPKTICDKNRDKYTSGLFSNIKYEKCFNHTEQNAAVVTDLNNVISKYKGINKLSLIEQTAATDNMLDELKVVLNGNESFLHLTRWIPLIEEMNNQFKEVSSDIIKNRANLKETEAASAIAPQLTDDLQKLYTLMFAHAQIGSSERIVAAYKELETLINSVN